MVMKTKLPVYIMEFVVVTSDGNVKIQLNFLPQPPKALGTNPYKQVPVV